MCYIALIFLQYLLSVLKRLTDLLLDQRGIIEAFESRQDFIKRTLWILGEGWKKDSCGLDCGLIFGVMFSPFFFASIILAQILATC